MDFLHPQLERLLDYWKDRRRGRRFPLRDDIDPLDFGYVLGHVLLVDVEREPAIRFRYRLWGTDLARDYGQEMTGRYVDQLQPPSFAERVQQHYLEALAAAEPQLHKFDDVIGERWFTHERLLMPLGLKDAPETVGMILGAIYRRPHDGEN